MIASLRELARALGGEVAGGQVQAPGPGHSRRDRSMSVRISPSAPDGFLAFSHAGDSWQSCRDHIRGRLGLKPANLQVYRNERRPLTASPPNDDDDTKRIADALAIWEASVDPHNSLVERYFASRKLTLDEEIAESVIRWNGRIGAMVCLFRSIRNGEPQAISRTFLDADARKLERKFMGPVGAAAVMLDGFDEVHQGLHIAEGIESAQAARQLQLRPAWALGSAGAIAAFPVLDGVETLTLLAEHDEASARAVEACAARWHAAGREVLINRPLGGKDLNDVLKGDAA